MKGRVKTYHRFGVIALAMLFTVVLNGQDVLNQLIPPNPGLASLQDHLDYIDEAIAPWSLSYSTSRFDAKVEKSMTHPSLTIREYLQKLFANYNIALVTRDQKILIVVQGIRQIEQVHIFGYIRDIQNGEVLAGANIVDSKSGKGTQSNHAGYYNLKVPAQEIVLEVSYLGYAKKSTPLEIVKEQQYDISLDFQNELNTIVISSKSSSGSEYWEGGEKVDLTRLKKYGSITGDNDLFDDLRVMVGTGSGNEGQGGFFVRGGAADQNLILLDGVAMYEVSHTAGMSSIFIDESIRDAILIKNGFSSEYGGRMSSVLDINLKDGHYKKVHGTINASAFGGKFHLEGPLKEGRTSFNFSAKTSWINAFLNRLIRDEVQYDDIGIKYQDVTLKLSHRFTPTSRISYSLYTGSDDIELEKIERSFDDESNPLLNNFRFRENNSLSWGSRVHAINYDQVFGKNWFWQVSLGKVAYNYFSSGYYEFIRQDMGVPDTRILDVTTDSGINDHSASSTLEYYISGDHRIKFGGNYINHFYKPTLRQSDIRIQGDSEVERNNSRTYRAHEIGVFVDDNILLKPWWRINAGFRLSLFQVDQKTYQNVEPRFLSTFNLNENTSLGISASRMTQNVHLLVNPGIGLPSDLWVPSTSTLAPEISDQISVNLDQKFPFGFSFYASAYLKQLKNVLDYSASEDLFFTILNDDKVTPIDFQSRSWEERVESGRGASKGLEISLTRNSGFLQGWVAYTLSKTTRTFDKINDGITYPYRFDRRHDLNIGANLLFSESFDFSAKWVYGSGYAVTLALEEIKTPFEGTVVVPDGRNNLRMSPFHHLDLQVNYHFIGEKNQVDVSLGIYNVYNRLNQYYIYLFTDRFTGKRSFRQVSLFPILPSLSVEYRF